MLTEVFLSGQPAVSFSVSSAATLGSSKFLVIPSTRVKSTTPPPGRRELAMLTEVFLSEQPDTDTTASGSPSSLPSNKQGVNHPGMLDVGVSQIFLVLPSIFSSILVSDNQERFWLVSI